tara:strand:- start:10 stop:216 length:207 start_codon:yes stop_codon:yes gene_type:complete
MSARKQFFGEIPGDDELAALLVQTREQVITEDDLQEQRISFAFGNALGSDNITKDSVRETSRHIRLRA